MDGFNKEKYSIKKKLNDHLQQLKQNVSLTEIKQNSWHIYTPKDEGFFLRSIQKQIKQEGSILKRIKKKISQFKDAKLKTKNIKNSSSYYMNSMFSPSSVKNLHAQKIKVLEHVTTYSSPINTPHRQIYSSNSTKRGKSKIKFDSFTASKAKKFQQQDKPNPKIVIYRQIENRVGNLPSNNFQYFVVNKQRKSAEQNAISKNSFECSNFSLSGKKPQWRNFECYRNWNFKKKESIVK